MNGSSTISGCCSVGDDAGYDSGISVFRLTYFLNVGTCYPKIVGLVSLFRKDILLRMYVHIGHWIAHRSALSLR